MDAKTLKALEGSIKKWEKIVAGKGYDLGTRNCPLCIEFVDDLNCAGCPVSSRTKQSVCNGTPYPRFVWSNDVEFTLKGNKVGGPKSLKAAEDMLAFLKRLRPRKKVVKRAGNAK